MRSRLPLLTILLAGSALMLPHFAHAAIPFYGPIIPSAWNLCPSNWAGLITVANNIISFLITITITFIAPLMFAYGGFLYLTSGSSPGNRSQANSLMLNTVIGICIALASWLIVDALLAVLYNPSAVGASWYSLITANGSTCINVAGSLSQSAGATNAGTCTGGLTCQSGVCYPPPQQCGSNTCQGGQVCGSDGNTCVYPAGVSCGSITCQPNYTCQAPGAAQLSSPATDEGPAIQITGQSGNGCSAGSQLSGSECYSCPSGDTLSGTLCIPPTSTIANGGFTCVPPPTCTLGAPSVTGTDSNGGQTLSYGSGPCDASTLLSDTNNTLTSAQANTFACIAKYEDSCNAAPSPPNPCWNKDCNTGNGKASTAAGAFQVLMASNSSCYDNSVCETAAHVSGPLNCKNAFTSNGYIADQSKAQACLNAANDLQCSITAAQCLMNQNNGSFSAWTADSHSSGQAQCIANGGG